MSHTTLPELDAVFEATNAFRAAMDTARALRRKQLKLEIDVNDLQAELANTGVEYDKAFELAVEAGRKLDEIRLSAHTVYPRDVPRIQLLAKSEREGAHD